MNLEGLKKSMKRQEGQRSVKKYIVLFILLVIVVIFIVLKGADIESVWNAMKNADPKWLTAGLGLAAVFNIAEGINLRKVLVSFGYRVRILCIYWLFLQFGNTIGDRRTAIAAICDEQR